MCHPKNVFCNCYSKVIPGTPNNGTPLMVSFPWPWHQRLGRSKVTPKVLKIWPPAEDSNGISRTPLELDHGVGWIIEKFIAYTWVFPKIVVFPQIIHFRVPLFLETPTLCSSKIELYPINSGGGVVQQT